MEDKTIEIKEVIFPRLVSPNELESFFEDLILSRDIESVTSVTLDRGGETLNHDGIVINESSENITLTPQRSEGNGTAYRGFFMDPEIESSQDKRYALMKKIADKFTVYFSSRK